MDKQISIPKLVKKLNELLFIDKVQLFNVYFYAILSGLVALSLPLGIQSIISFVMAGTFSTSIVVLICLVIGGTFVNGLLQVRQLQIIETLEQKIFVKFAYAYTGILPSLNLEKYRHVHFPEYVNRFFEVVSLQKGLKKILIDVPTAFIQISIGLILLSFYHPVFIALGLLLLTVLFLIFYFTFERGLKMAYYASENKYDIIGWIEEVARTVPTFKLQMHSNLSVKSVDHKLDQYLYNRTNYFNVFRIQLWSMISFKTLITAGLLIIGTYLLVSQQINVGQFIASDIVIISVMNSVEKLMLSLENIYETLVSNDKLTKILEMESDPTIGFQFNEQSVKQFQLDVRNLSYRFEDTTEVLHRLNFSVKAVQLVLLRGSSGSGKSLLLKILLGIYREHKGSLLLNGMELSNYDIYSVRQHIGVYFGLNEIVEGSLYDNIVMENKNIPLSHIHDMANITGLSDDLLHYKIDFNDTISIYQMHLSKSIRSKILLTRLLVGGQKILFLEDAFKFLDKQETKRLFDYWRKNKYTILCTTDDNDYDTFFDQVYNLNPSGEEIESV